MITEAKYAKLEDRIIELYQQLKSLRKVKEKLAPDGPSHETISKILKDNKVLLRPIRSYEKLTQEEQAELIQACSNGKNIKELAKSYNVHLTTATRVLKKHNLEIKKQRKYALDETVFDEINSESAYWLGFLYGRSTIKGGNRIDVICMKEKHKQKIEELRKFLKFEKPIRTIIAKTKNGREYTTYRLIIGSKKLAQRLTELGAGTLKSIKYPDFLNGYDSQFIEGYYAACGYYTKDGELTCPGNENFKAEIFTRLQHVTLKGFAHETNN